MPAKRFGEQRPASKLPAKAETEPSFLQTRRHIRLAIHDHEASRVEQLNAMRGFNGLSGYHGGARLQPAGSFMPHSADLATNGPPGNPRVGFLGLPAGAIDV